ncbi:hypothetical protein CANCADRAFT_30114 [Tortispora caseinolytica NRRL Y-17796]|uniref:HTH APSES-type domain-containing protein n=1 Tax=Tortispora caseinolytica NRRL Y-17796 TaxID=767744 RepID=A0A1E4TJE1_9ASCO|nr:hypothetical protein CANCADRAFT_30114 [Tortispora caseinolytica NRRL Y-17796]
MASPSTFTAPQPNGVMTPHAPPPRPAQQVSPIYTANYSGIQVLEMTIDGVPVMRRLKDSWFNVTQILKVAGVERGRRMRILERDVVLGEHEKVQGGHGRYQGTWIPIDRARSICSDFSILDFMNPLLNANPELKYPTREELSIGSITRRERRPSSSKSTNKSNPGSLFNSPLSDINLHSPTNGSLLKTPLSASASAALAALGKSHQTPPNYVSPNTNTPRYNADGLAAPSSSVMTMSSQQQQQAAAHSLLPSVSLQPATPFQHASSELKSPLSNGTEPPKKRQKNDDEVVLDLPHRALEPLSLEGTSNFEQSKELLTDIFLDNNAASLKDVLKASQNTTVHFDVPIDDLGHTALHWAAALGRESLVRELIANGANSCRGNYAGETPLMRAVLVTNNFDLSIFPQMLNHLAQSLIITDKSGRTVLHHIALTAGIKGRSTASRYYLESLFEWLVKHGASGPAKGLNLGRFVNLVCNAKDRNGDTALNIASRVGNKSIVHQLLEVGADPHIPNRAGIRATDFGIGHLLDKSSAVNSQSIENGGRYSQEDPDSSRVSGTSLAATAAAATAQITPSTLSKSQDIITAMESLITNLNDDFKAEIGRKQQAIDKVHSNLRELSSKLGIYRSGAELVKSKTNNLADLKQQVQNLERALQVEDAEFRRKNPNSEAITQAFRGEFDADQPFRNSEGLPLPVLRARVAAYQANRDILRDLATQLQSRSSELESKYRKVVSLCTGVEEGRVDSLLEGLLHAVESDSDLIDTSRIASFLQRVSS